MGMNAVFPPSPESLARIAKSGDADVLSRTIIAPHLNRGRGAQSNQTSKFEPYSREAVDDGWGNLEALVSVKTNVRDEKSKSIITKNDSPDIHFDRSINPYRGCEHGCVYCFARPTHTYLGHSAGLDFERELYAKTNAADRLYEAWLNKKYSVKPIAIGTNTDPYQPIERDKKIMRALLEKFVAHKHPITITTKSSLIVRDLDLLTELAKQNLVHVTMSITSLDHILSRKLEPRASSPARRLEAVELLTAAGIPVSVAVAPIIPAINDAEIEKILAAASANGASGAAMIMLRLPGEVRQLFREWLLRHYPDRLRHVLNLVRDVRQGRENDPRFHSRMAGQGPYAFSLQRRFDLAVERYGMKKRLPHLRTDLFTPPKVEDPQLSLF